jgi:ATP-binding cassette subfamily B protein
VLTAFALLPLPLMSVAIYFISATIHRQSDRVQTQQSRLSTFVQQHIAGIRVLQSYHREADAADRFEQDANEYKGRVLGLVRTEALFGPVIVLLVGLSTILTIYVGGLRVAAGALELGHIFQFVFYVNLLTWPFASVGWVTSLTQKAEASMARINAFLLAGPELVDAGQRTDAPEPGVRPRPWARWTFSPNPPRENSCARSSGASISAAQRPTIPSQPPLSPYP